MQAVPEFLRQFDEKLTAHLGEGLPIDAAPVTFSSWMGGDRDGNPFVTSEVTREVLLLSRWKAADLYLQDVKELVSELSMVKCNDEVRDLAGDEHEPYRAILKDLRTKLTHTRDVLDAKIKGWMHQATVSLMISASFGTRFTPATAHSTTATWASSPTACC